MTALKNARSGNRQARRRRNPVADCPLTAAIGGKWKLIIVYWLAESPQHFAGLGRRLPEISPKVLAEQLRELAEDEIVARRPTGAPPAPVEYSLTDYGRTLLPLVEDVLRWGRGHIDRFSAPDAASR